MAMISPQELASKIDLTLLKPNARREDIKKLCENAVKYKFYAVCVNPYHVKFVSELLKDTEVKVCTVIGFPLGANTLETKVFEARQAVENGADEIDVVANIGAIKDGNFKYVEDEIRRIATEVRKLKSDTVIKVIIETAYLTDEEKIKVCKTLIKAGADFVKTSTGFAERGATIEDVKLLKRAGEGKLKVKAAGGIRTLEFAIELLKAGADRLGASRGVEIIEEAIKTSSSNSSM